MRIHNLFWRKIFRKVLPIRSQCAFDEAQFCPPLYQPAYTRRFFKAIWDHIYSSLPFLLPMKKYYPFIKTLREDAHDDDDETCFLPLGSTAVVHHIMKFARWPRWTWYRMFSCGLMLESVTLTSFRHASLSDTSVLFRTDQSSRFLIARDFFPQESTVRVISCSLAKCCTTCSVGQSFTILLRDCTINRNLHLHLYLQGKACTHKHCWRTKMVSGTLNNTLKDIEVSFRAAYDILAISHKGFSDFALKKISYISTVIPFTVVVLNANLREWFCSEPFAGSLLDSFVPQLKPHSSFCGSLL